VHLYNTREMKAEPSCMSCSEPDWKGTAKAGCVQTIRQLSDVLRGLREFARHLKLLQVHGSGILEGFGQRCVLLMKTCRTACLLAFLFCQTLFRDVLFFSADKHTKEPLHGTRLHFYVCGYYIVISLLRCNVKCLTSKQHIQTLLCTSCIQ
jgi:hypothetical protein